MLNSLHMSDFEKPQSSAMPCDVYLKAVKHLLKRDFEI